MKSFDGLDLDPKLSQSELSEKFGQYSDTIEKLKKKIEKGGLSPEEEGRLRAEKYRLEKILLPQTQRLMGG
jgi:hypothetical protein